MIAPATTRLWVFRGIYVLIAAVLVLARMLPISTLPPHVPGPDLLLCVSMAWLLRRPDIVTAPIIVAVFLLEGLLVMRPPGIWALMVLLGSEFLRDRAAAMRGLPFLAEWLTISAVITAMMLGNRFVLFAMMIEQPSLVLAGLHLATTILAYPFVVGATFLAFGGRNAAGELNPLGRS